jgi:hypothetical protein
MQSANLFGRQLKIEPISLMSGNFLLKVCQSGMFLQLDTPWMTEYSMKSTGYKLKPHA